MMLTAVATPASSNADSIEAYLRSKRDAIAAKELEITAAEAECSNLVARDKELCDAVNENQRLAAIPEPQAADFDKLDEWHPALRKWRADQTELAGKLPPLERDRNHLATQSIPAAKNRVAALRRELARLELDAAKDEHQVAQRHADEMLARVQRLQGALAAIG